MGVKYKTIFITRIIFFIEIFKTSQNMWRQDRYFGRLSVWANSLTGGDTFRTWLHIMPQPNHLQHIKKTQKETCQISCHTHERHTHKHGEYFKTKNTLDCQNVKDTCPRPRYIINFSNFNLKMIAFLPNFYIISWISMNIRFQNIRKIVTIA